MTSGHAPQTGANGGEDRGPVRTTTPLTDAMTQAEPGDHIGRVRLELLAESELRDRTADDTTPDPVCCRAVHIEPVLSDVYPWYTDVVYRCDLEAGHDGAHHQTTPPAMFGMWQGADGG